VAKSHKDTYRKDLVKTLLIVCEGSTDQHFLNYLKELYYVKNKYYTIKIQNAHGGGNTLNHSKSWKFHKYLIVQDTDKNFPAKNKLKNKHIIGMTPCLEGFFLKILKKEVNNDSNTCKKRWADYIKKDIKDIPKIIPEDYKEYLPKEKLDGVRKSVKELQALLDFFEGKWPDKPLYCKPSFEKITKN
jgi:hypothetical protein